MHMSRQVKKWRNILLDVCSDPCLHSDGFEQAGVPERHVHHLFNLSQLFTTTPDVIIPDVIQALLLILTPSTYDIMTRCRRWNGETVQVWWNHTYLSFDWFSFTVDDGIRGNDAVWGGVCFYDFKLHCSHASSDQEYITCRKHKSKQTLVNFGTL